ncbi:MAG: Glu-tRNA(Gln) amidotransferase subunit GatE [Candidatus Micrarchaeaceae archaeon]
MDFDYKSLGFKCGLEIHQRLDTKEKLFCKCATDESGGELGSISRRQRAVAGELGAIDKSAIFEQGKGKTFIYKVFEKTSCMVELDEQPPYEMNEDALDIALSIAKALGIRIVDEFQPMRKEVVDGSNPSAFQRTVMLGYDGSINIEGFKIPITFVALEEESCGIAGGDEKEAIYNVDRLGIPLIEIDTGPTIPDPETAKKAALYLGMLLRLTGRVKRGIGTIRQDVNVSIAKGNRVEIKGLQEVEKMDKFIENEVFRQEALAEIAEELRHRKAEVLEPKELTSIFANTHSKLIKNAVEGDGIVMGFGLKGFNGLLGREVGKNRRLGSEISDYAKAAGAGGIIHSDENLADYGISIEEAKKAREKLGGDSFIMIAAKREIAKKAIELAAMRSRLAIEGVPAETRAAVNDDTYITKFLRPIPGGERMYPETDIKPILFTKEMNEKAEKSKPNLEEELEKLEKALKDKEAAKRLLLSQRYALYKYIASSTHAEPEFVANTLMQKFTELSRKGIDIDGISKEGIADAFKAVEERRITKQALEEVIVGLSRHEGSVDEIIEKKGLKMLSYDEVAKIVSSFKGASKSSIAKSVMSKYRLNIDGDMLLKALENI